MATWTKLKDGSWGIRSTTACKPGDVVTVEKKDGSKKSETIGAVIWTGDGVWLCSVAPKAAQAGQAPAPRQAPARPAGWRPCGYPGCNPSYCDDCDGLGGRTSDRRNRY